MDPDSKKSVERSFEETDENGIGDEVDGIVLVGRREETGRRSAICLDGCLTDVIIARVFIE